MSYIVIPVYDFACDGKDANGKECSQIIDATPANMGTSRLLDKAHQLIRDDKWEVARVNGEWMHYCPAHAGGNHGLG